MARLASPALIVLAASLAAPIAGAEPSHVQGEAGSIVPLGSFENAGVAVFIRAHEARRNLGALAGPKPLAYAPVASGLAIHGLDPSSGLEIAMPETTGSMGRTRWVVPSDQPARPGALSARDPVEVATPFAKSGLLEAHRTPDLEVEVSKRATIGIFGEANKIEPTDIRNSTVRSTRDVGAGVTLQYRFGE